MSACCADRWVSSILIHTSFQHVLSNMLLFVVLSWQIEEKYGAFRVAFIFFWSAIGGEPKRALLQILTITNILLPQAALLFFTTSHCYFTAGPPLDSCQFISTLHLLEMLATVEFPSLTQVPQEVGHYFRLLHQRKLQESCCCCKQTIHLPRQALQPC